MEPKMSVGLDPQTIGMPSQPWQPGATPALKLTPSIPSSAQTEPWRNPLSAQPLSAPPTSRYSPAFLLASPGVSGEIAGGLVENQPNTHSNSLSDLFSAPEYQFSTVKAPHTNNSTTAPLQSPKKTSPNLPTPTNNTTSSRPALRPPQPPPLQPPHNLRNNHKPPTMSYAPSTFRAPPMQHSLSAQSPPHPSLHVSTPAYSAPASQSLGLHTPIAPPQPQNYSGYSVLPPSQHPQAPQPPPQPPRVEPMIAPLPNRTQGTEEIVKPSDCVVAANMPMPSTGHRSVLGSGIVSTAVQEAQVRARMKAETFAKNRKRKRRDDLDGEEKVDKAQAEEDSKLSPEQLRKKRYMRRLALNRESAAVSRVRRREYVKLLEEQLVNAEKERVRLATELNDMQKRHSELREHLIQLESRVNENGGDQQNRATY